MPPGQLWYFRHKDDDPESGVVLYVGNKVSKYGPIKAVKVPTEETTALSVKVRRVV